MDFIDYREKLGIGFCDEQKFQYFLTRVFNFLNNIKQQGMCSISYSEYISFCLATGTEMDVSLNGSFDGLNRLSDIIRVLRSHKNSLQEFLAYYVWFANSIDPERDEMDDELTKSDFILFLTKTLELSHIPFEVLEDGEKFFVFPKGAKELDNALVSDVLSWLQGYPKAQKTYINALKQYADGIYIRDTADNFRKALKEFCQEFLGNTKNLGNNISEVFKYLGANNIEPEVASLMKSLMSTYDTLNNKVAKHHDKVDEKLLEFLMYQTGIFIRMLIVVNRSVNSSQMPTN